MCGGCAAETDDDVTMELELPFWTDAGDVRVTITSCGVSVEVRNTLSIQRTYWRNRCSLPEFHHEPVPCTL